MCNWRTDVFDWNRGCWECCKDDDLGDGIFLCIFVGVSNWGFVSGAFTDMDQEVVCVFEIVHCEQEVCEVDTER